MKILVTGPDGVLGSNLVRELIKRNYKVSVLIEPGKSPTTLINLQIKIYYGNILDKECLNSVMGEMDIVFHCAASTSLFPARSNIVKRVNIEGTKNIIEACIKHAVKRLIYVGTAASFGCGSKQEGPGNENSSYLAEKYELDYLDSKYEAQQLVLKATKEKKLPAIIVNPTFMIGPFDSKPSSGAMILAIANKKVPGYTCGGKNYVAVKDVSIAMVNAITMGRIGECYILGNENLGYEMAFKKIATVLGVRAPDRKLSDNVVVGYGKLNSFLAKMFNYFPTVTKEMSMISCESQFYSSEKARKELLLPQTPIEVAIKECYDWFKESGYLNK